MSDNRAARLNLRGRSLVEPKHRFNRIRTWLAGLIAFVIGFPFCEKVLAGGSDIAGSAVDLGLSIAGASDGS
jgi:hypothetical protein